MQKMSIYVFRFFSHFCLILVHCLVMNGQGLWAQTRTSNPNKAFTGSIMNNISLGLGVINRFPGSIQIDEFGGMNTITTFHPLLTAAINLNPILRNFSPTFSGSILLPEEGSPGEIKRLTYYLLSNLLWPSDAAFQVKGGLGLYLVRIWGPGGTLHLENGNSFVEFPLPARAMTAINLVGTLGAQFVISSAFSGQFDILLFNLFGEQDRDQAYIVGINFHWGISSVRFKNRPVNF